MLLNRGCRDFRGCRGYRGGVPLTRHEYIWASAREDYIEERRLKV